MKTKKLHILTIAVIFLIGCRKEDISVDREDLLPTDTAYVLYSTMYNSNTATSVEFTVDLLQLNGKQSEANYSNAGFLTPTYVSDTSMSISSIVNNQPTIAEYSTVILFDYSETFFYEENYVGFFLRRFFEIADSLPNRNVALSSMSAEDNTPTQFHSEDPGNIFGNSWDFSITEFYKKTTNLDDHSNSASGNFFKNRIMGVIDSLVAAPQAAGELSVTLIYGYGGYSLINTDANEVIDYALANNVKINIVSPSFNFEMTRIANETGGFISNRLFRFNNYSEGFSEENPRISQIQIPLLNLDDLLMHNVKTLQATITYNVSTENWTSGSELQVWLNYNGDLIEVGLRIP